MILPNKRDSIHKAWLYRLLSAIYDNRLLAGSLYFKGGSCAAMLGVLDRFSVDLDFDYISGADGLTATRRELEGIFDKLGLAIKDRSQKVPQYFLRYPAGPGQRNTIKIDATFPSPKANIYQTVRLKDIDRIITCQSVETMFANKMVALVDRWEKSHSIAGRDIYDIHHFFMQGIPYNVKVIEERRCLDIVSFLQDLTVFIEKHMTQTIINQDLNALLPPDKFKRIKPLLRNETLMFLRDEIEKIS